MSTIAALQRHRVNRVVNHIRHNLHDTLDVERLADIACLSRFHFSRVFSNQMGETPGSYVNRIRIERAAGQLMHRRGQAITDIAIDCGFSGSDSFARAFRHRFEISPRQFRGLRHAGQDVFAHTPALKRQLYLPGTALEATPQPSFDVRIEERPAYHVAYIRRLGPYGDVGRGISNAFRDLQRWAAARGVLDAGSSFLGRGGDDCSVTPAQHCLYDACLVLDAELREDDVVSVQTIPGGTFAVLRAKSTPQQVNRHWDWLTRVWVPSTGYQMAQKPCYEFFPEVGPNPFGPEHGIEICAAVSKLPTSATGKNRNICQVLICPHR